MGGSLPSRRRGGAGKSARGKTMGEQRVHVDGDRLAARLAWQAARISVVQGRGQRNKRLAAAQAPGCGGRAVGERRTVGCASASSCGRSLGNKSLLESVRTARTATLPLLPHSAAQRVAGRGAGRRPRFQQRLDTLPGVAIPGDAASGRGGVTRGWRVICGLHSVEKLIELP